MQNKQPIITNIQRMSLDDGPGIRTTVFLKGCPLRCKWCHNPECMDRTADLYFVKNFGSRCFQGSFYELCTILERDRVFYDATGGGVTFSGGEPLLYPEFLFRSEKALYEKGIRTAVDTCGFVPWNSLKEILPVTDLFLFDLKALSPALHKELTGQENGLILKNLKKLLAEEKKIRLRIPVVGEANLQELLDIIKQIPESSLIERVELLPYHAYGIKKYKEMGMSYEGVHFKIPEKQVMEEAEELLKEKKLHYRIG